MLILVSQLFFCHSLSFFSSSKPSSPHLVPKELSWVAPSEQNPSQKQKETEKLTVVTIRSPPVVPRRTKRVPAQDLGAVVSLAVRDAHAAPVDRRRPDGGLAARGLALFVAAAAAAAPRVVVVVVVVGGGVIGLVLAITIAIVVVVIMGVMIVAAVVVMMMFPPVVVIVIACVVVMVLVVLLPPAAVTLVIPVRDQYLPHRLSYAVGQKVTILFHGGD